MIPPVTPPAATTGSPATPAEQESATAPAREPAASASPEDARADEDDGGTREGRSPAAGDGSRASRRGRHAAGEPVVRDVPPDHDDAGDADDQPVR